MTHYFKSSVGKKQLMGLMGLFLSLFLVVHLLGNISMLVSPEAFNTYAHKLTSLPIIYIAEAGLLLIFLIHVGLGIRLTIENREARPEKYYTRTTTGKGATFASSTMPYTGILILIFLVTHLVNFKFGTYYSVNYGGTEMRDLHRLMLEFYQSPFNIFIYIAAMVMVGLHLSHGIWSLFQTFGFNLPKYDGLLRIISKSVAALITLGFCLFPLWAFFNGR